MTNRPRRPFPHCGSVRDYSRTRGSKSFGDSLNRTLPRTPSVWSRGDSAWCRLIGYRRRFEPAVRGAVVDSQCRASTTDCHWAVPRQTTCACVRTSRSRCGYFNIWCIDTGTRTLVRSAATWTDSLCSPRRASHRGPHPGRHRCTQQVTSCAPTKLVPRVLRISPIVATPVSHGLYQSALPTMKVALDKNSGVIRAPV